MSIYIFLFIMIVAWGIIEISFKHIKAGILCVKTRNIAFWSIFVVILVLGIFKSETYGYDAGSYKTFYFDYYTQVSLPEIFSTGIEPGFALLSFIICKITSRYWIYRAILFMLTFGGLSKVVWDKSKNVSLSYLLFVSLGFISLDMFILRQALAVTIIFCGYGFLENRRYLPFSLVILLASTFHATALISFVLFPLASRNSTGVLMLKRGGYVGSAVVIGSLFLPMLSSLYSKNDYSASMISGEGKGMLLFLLVYFGAVSLFMNWYSGKKNMRSYNSVFEYCLGSIYLQIIALFFSLFTRCIYYALVYAIVAVPNIATAMNINSRKTFWAFTFICMGIMYYMTVLNGTALIPYVSIWG